jgi:hypothetical protein
MASDDTRPKVRMLFTIGVVSVFLLLAVKFVLDSYYLDMTESYEHTLLPKPTLRDQTKKEQLADIDQGKNGAIPVDLAMQMLEQKGRNNASPDLVPQQSDDTSPLEGWGQLKRELHLPVQRADWDAGADAEADAGTESTDAGATTTAAGADAGAVHAAPAHDGGVRVHPAPPQHAPTHPGTTKDGGK